MYVSAYYSRFLSFDLIGHYPDLLRLNIIDRLLRQQHHALLSFPARAEH